jgi:hypothetical protein
MQRILIAVIVALVVLVGVQRLRRNPAPATPAAATPAAATPESPGAGAVSPPVELLTANQLTALVRRYPSPTVLVLYGTTSALSRNLMSGLEQVASRHRSDGLLIHAVNVDPDSAAYDIPIFMHTTAASFPAVRLVEPGPVELGRALESAGSDVIKGDSAYTLPVVVVWDAAGTVVAQGQGMADAGELERVVSGVLAKAR